MPELENRQGNKGLQYSQISKSRFNNFLTSLFGFRRNNSTRRGLEFVNVDIGSKERVGQALLDRPININSKMGQKLDGLLESWLTETTDKIEEITERKKRIDQIQFMVLNDPYVGRTVDLYADESTQLDDQDTLIRIETPDPEMTKVMYKLLNQWGLTQTRVRSTIKQLVTYGDAFWANRVTENGVEAIYPLNQLSVTDRLEFSPVKVLEMRKRREGMFAALSNNNYLIDQMLDSLEETEDFADIFDTKLFGFSIENNVVASPWSITHFRVDADGGDFFPWGTSPIIGALAPYKQTQSTISLQSLARVLNFPTTIYSVKTNDAMDETSQFAVVNKVREAYDNIGVKPQEGSSEVYSVNTKIWIPKDLLDVDVKKADVSVDGIDDVKLYQDREAVALGLPRSFFGDQGWFSHGNSGRALAQQYKPFGRKCFSIQSAFLEGLADEFRIHFAITGQYDFRVPFTLSMKYPAEDVSEDRYKAQGDSLSLTKDVVELIKTAIGATEDEGLPPDVVRDIVGKYSFLDPADIMKWTRNAKFSLDFENVSSEDLGNGAAPEAGGLDLGDLDVEETPEDAEAAVEESKETVRKRLREKALRESYKEKKDEIYFDILKEKAVNTFIRESQHVEVFNTISTSNSLMLETLNKQGKKNNKLQESEDKSLPTEEIPDIIEESDNSLTKFHHVRPRRKRQK